MGENTVIVNLSNRHIHLSRADVDALFGQGYQLTKTKDLQQPGQFACAETVDISGSKGTLEKVRILGPERIQTQCEILASDCFKLGASGCPVRESGQLRGSHSFRVSGPKGTIDKDEGLIIAKRHIHFDPESAKKFGITNGQNVRMRLGTDRAVIFENVVCRVSPAYALECHIDFDEGNAAGVSSGVMGEVIS